MNLIVMREAGSLRLITAVNLERDYKPLAIYSPREVAIDEDEEI